MTRLIQIQNGTTRAVALVEEPRVRLLVGVNSVFQLAQEAADTNTPLTEVARKKATGEFLDYDPIYAGASPWRLLPPMDQPDEPARCLVSGTGLTHLGSAMNRQAMHSVDPADLNDSMKMFRWGLERGKPAPGKIGVAPEWFYKGNGTILRAHGEPLDVPAYADGGGEEGEIAGVYFIDAHGQPRRVGMAIGNEFSDHRFEAVNMLNLASSKIRTCALGPELLLNPDFQSVPGKVAIERAGRELWSRQIATGEQEMSHSLANIEHHHFKFETHRRPGNVHVHYFGACGLSYGDGIKLVEGDIMTIAFTGFGRPLRNPLRAAPGEAKPIAVKPLA